MINQINNRPVNQVVKPPIPKQRTIRSKPRKEIVEDFDHDRNHDNDFEINSATLETGNSPKKS